MSLEPDYPQLVQEALRSVVRSALETVAVGRLGDFHVYVGFRTADPEVRIPDYLRDTFPEEMRVVLQNQFWDLVVDEWGFSVTLSFNGQRQQVSIPFTAVTAFYDVDQDFALRFATPEELAAARDGAVEGDEPPTGEEPASKEKESSGEDDDAGKSGKVVSLDDFRRR